MNRDLECYKCSARFNDIIWEKEKVTANSCPNCDNVVMFKVVN